MALQCEKSRVAFDDRLELRRLVEIQHSVLLSGGTALGRRRLAHSLFGEGNRSSGGFLAVDCTRGGGLTTLLARQWGTVYLDRVDQLDAGSQDLLMRYLEKPRRVRVIAGADDLWAAVQAGAFAPRLFYRLNVIQLSAHAGALSNRIIRAKLDV